MYNKKITDLVEEFGSNSGMGLDNESIIKNREVYGKNELEGGKKTPLIVKFLLQFTDVLIIILLVAAVVSLIIDPHEWVDSLIIFIVVMINAILGVYQESKAEKSLEALKKMSSPTCKVIRNGVTIVIDTKDCVVGDIILVEAGDYIPSDARIIECSNLSVDESALTGESVPVNKISDVIESADLPLGDQKNMLFSQTFVTNGRGKAIVTGVGMKTQMGKIAQMLDETTNEKTPLQNKLTQVGKVIGLICIVICVVVFFMEWLGVKSNPLDAFKSAVALAVAAIPEGLATVVTIVLSIGVSKMVKKNAIVKKLPAVETLGCTSVVCSDKTGTLTQNRMTVVEVYQGKKIKSEELTPVEQDLVSYFALCSDAKINFIDGVEKRIGDPTETALIELNNRYGKDISTIERISDLPFDSDRKLMTVLVKLDGKYVSITKGAPDIVFSRSIKGDIKEAAIANEEMSNRALRVLALGIKTYNKMPENLDNAENDLTFVGLVGMIDPERPEVKEAIKLAKKSGIRTVMITGDHITTAKAIARNLGILNEGQKAITSTELQSLSDEYLDEHIEEYSVYARVAPSDKVRIVSAWQKKGNVVAMTGDGVNDAPALKKAEIGCAMGITGTDVSKEASDMILVDDNFTTIINAVKEGRGIYANVKKCVKYLLSSNIGEVLTIFVASIISSIMVANGNLTALPIPLLAIHLLWINLITDSLPAFGLGMEEVDDAIMDEKPRPKKEGFFANHLAVHIIVEGIFVGGLTLASFLIGYHLLSESSAIVGQTMAFFTLSTTQLFHAYNVKSDHSVINKQIFKNKFLNFSFIVGFVLQVGVIYIPGVNSVFKLQALNASQFFTALGCAFSIVLVMEAYKLISRIIKK